MRLQAGVGSKVDGERIAAELVDYATYAALGNSHHWEDILDMRLVERSIGAFWTSTRVFRHYRVD